MPVEYNWVGDYEDSAKLKRESRRGEWEAGMEREGEIKREGRQKERDKAAEVSGWISLIIGPGTSFLPPHLRCLSQGTRRLSGHVRQGSVHDRYDTELAILLFICPSFPVSSLCVSQLVLPALSLFLSHLFLSVSFSAFGS